MYRGPRWIVYGIVDGSIAGCLTGGAVMVIGCFTGSDPEALDWIPLGLMFGAMYGLAIGLIGGLLIDVLRAFGIGDGLAVLTAMTPFLGWLLWSLRDGGWGWIAFVAAPLAVIVADLCWRLHRLRSGSGWLANGTPTVLL